MLSVAWFYVSVKSRKALVVIILWAVLQSILGYFGFYQDTSQMPPRIMLFGIFPTIILMAALFVTAKGKTFIDNVNLKTLTYFHSIRIPVEIILALLFYHGVVSQYMTYEGTNFDLFSGVTAPIVAFIAFKNILRKKLLLWWNIICLLLLLNVVITAVFALPSPFQQLAFEQPNIAVLHFPFNLLPTVVVPLVLFAHLVAFRQLSK